MNAEELIEAGAKVLRKQRKNLSWTGDEPVQAEELLTFALGRKPRARQNIDAATQRKYDKLIARRATGEPIPYIVGWTEFKGLRFTVKPGGFVPRGTTEFLAEQAIRRIRRRPHPVAVDLCTGIGPVALAVAKAVPRAKVHGADISARTLAQARQNAIALKARNASFYKGDMLDGLPRAIKGKVDVVTIHPPYIAEHEIDELPAELKEFEPFESLTDESKDGMRLAKRGAVESRAWLAPGGWFLIEVGSYLARELKAVIKDAGYKDVKSTIGPLKYTRVIVGRNP